MFGLLLISSVQSLPSPLVLCDTSIVQYVGFDEHTLLVKFSSFSELNLDVISSSKYSMILRLNWVLFLNVSTTHCVYFYHITQQTLS